MLQTKIQSDIMNGKSTDYIVSKYLTRKTNSDDILEIVRAIKWNHYKKTGIKL